MKLTARDVTQAEETLVLFFDAMYAWENKYYTLARERGDRNLGPPFEEALDELRGIFEEYCLPDEVNLSRLDEPRLEFPSVYCRKQGTFYESSAGKNGLTFVYHQHAGVMERLRFTLRPTEDGWRIAKSERFVTEEDDWLPYSM